MASLAYPHTISESFIVPNYYYAYSATIGSGGKGGYCRRYDGSYPIYASTGITGYHCEYKIEPPCVVTGRSGSIGEVFYVDGKCWPLNTTLWVKDFKGTSPFFVYYKLKELELSKTVAGFAAVPTLNRNDVHMMVSSIPPKRLFIEFENEIKPVYNHKKTIKSECEILTEVQSLLLARMGQ